MTEENNGQFVISQEDWSLHRKGYDDQQSEGQEDIQAQGRKESQVQEVLQSQLIDRKTDCKERPEEGYIHGQSKRYSRRRYLIQTCYKDGDVQNKSQINRSTGYLLGGE